MKPALNLSLVPSTCFYHQRAHECPLKTVGSFLLLTRIKFIADGCKLDKLVMSIGGLLLSSVFIPP